MSSFIGVNASANSDPRCTLHIDRNAPLSEEFVESLPALGYNVSRSRDLLTFGLDFLIKTHDEYAFMLVENKSMFHILLHMNNVDRGWVLATRVNTSLGDRLRSLHEYDGDITESLPTCDEAMALKRGQVELRGKIDPIVGLVRQINEDEDLNPEFSVSWGEALIRSEALAFERQGVTDYPLERLISQYNTVLERARRASQGATDLYGYLAAVRRAALTGTGLDHYCYHKNTLFALDEERCGNCQVQTTYLIALHMDLGREWNEDWQLGVELFANHVRPVALNSGEGKLIDLMYQFVEDRKRTTMIYHPESFLRWALRNNRVMLHDGESEWIEEIRPISYGATIRNITPAINLAPIVEALRAAGEQGANELEIPRGTGVAYNDFSEMVPVYDFPISRFVFPAPEGGSPEERTPIFNADSDSFTDRTEEAQREAEEAGSETGDEGSSDGTEPGTGTNSGEPTEHADGLEELLGEADMADAEEVGDGEGDGTGEGDEQTLIEAASELLGGIYDSIVGSGEQAGDESHSVQISTEEGTLGLELSAEQLSVFQNGVGSIDQSLLNATSVQALNRLNMLSITNGDPTVTCSPGDMTTLREWLDFLTNQGQMTEAERDVYTQICQRGRWTLEESLMLSTRSLWWDLGAIDRSESYNSHEGHGSHMTPLPLIFFAELGGATEAIADSFGGSTVRIRPDQYRRIIAKLTYKEKLGEFIRILFTEKLLEIENEMVEVSSLGSNLNSADKIARLGPTYLHLDIRGFINLTNQLGFRQSQQLASGFFRIPDLTEPVSGFITVVGGLFDDLNEQPERVLSLARDVDQNLFIEGLDIIFDQEVYTAITSLSDLLGTSGESHIGKLQSASVSEWIGKIVYHPEYLFTYKYEPISETEARFLRRRELNVSWQTVDVQLPSNPYAPADACEDVPGGSIVATAAGYIECPRIEDATDGENDEAEETDETLPEEYAELFEDASANYREPIEIPILVLNHIIRTANHPNFDPVLLMLKLEMMSTGYMQDIVNTEGANQHSYDEISQLYYLMMSHDLPVSFVDVADCIEPAFTPACLNQIFAAMTETLPSESSIRAELPYALASEPYLVAAFNRFTGRESQQLFEFPVPQTPSFSHSIGEPTVDNSSIIRDLRSRLERLNSQMREAQYEFNHYETLLERSSELSERQRVQASRERNEAYYRLMNIRSDIQGVQYDISRVDSGPSNSDSYLEGLRTRKPTVYNSYQREGDWLFLIHQDHDFIQTQFSTPGEADLIESRWVSFMVSFLLEAFATSMNTVQASPLASAIHDDHLKAMTIYFLIRQGLAPDYVVEAINTQLTEYQSWAQNYFEMLNPLFENTQTSTPVAATSVFERPLQNQLLENTSRNHAFSQEGFQLSHTVGESMPPVMMLDLNIEWGSQSGLVDVTFTGGPLTNRDLEIECHNGMFGDTTPDPDVTFCFHAVNDTHCWYTKSSNTYECN